MGQAKQRGTYEQRKAEGEAKARKQRVDAFMAHAEREAALSPAEKRRRNNAATVLAAALAIGVGTK